ncbi:MAG: 3-deoxy-D-manno-octulosonic acid transferase [Candidatus Omnitrophica bacterium]|nr:3-deoxy-D-manno-octulosonic acid transferase [Candidatus Omnitrophota bacterium]
MIYLFYDILLLFAALVYLPFYAVRGRLHGRILSRIGIFDEDDLKASAGRRTVWIHAVSVGEARAAESLVRLIRKQWPQDRLVVSTVTPTGYAILKKVLKDDETAFFAPLDLSWVVRKFLLVLQPRLLVIMETELWPNLVRLSVAAGARVVVVNGRISDNSFKGYKRLLWLIGPVLKLIDVFCMQSAASAERIKALGAPADRVCVTGNIKFDLGYDAVRPPFLENMRLLAGDNMVLVAGSTHDNEEEMILGIFKSLHKDFPGLRLVIAPRHLERIDKVRRLVRINGLEAVFVSRLKSFSSGQVALLDTMGDLTALYELADVVFVGGSLVKKGGHNPIEPAVFGKPILFGNCMDNFREIRDIFIRQEAAIEVTGAQNLEYELRRLLASPAERKAFGERARGLLEQNRGATKRTVSKIAEEVNP